MKSVEPKQSICQFGIARGDITPPVGMYHRMWGAARHDRSAGVHRPLLASVLLFRQCHAEADSETQQMLVELDHCLLEAEEVDRLTSAIQKTTGIAREAIVVSYSHTHAAGLMSRSRAELPGGDSIPGYLDNMHATIAELAKQAANSLEEAVISYGEARCDLAAHRDYWDDENELWVCGYHPDGPADDTALVARVTNRDNQVLATIVNYACHPTTLAWDNQLVSPDFPGAMREAIEEATGAPCVFIQGASGDLGPREGFVGDVEVADRNGRQLGYAALSAITALPQANTQYRYQGPVVSGATIGQWRHEPMPDEQIAAASAWQIDRTELPIAYRPELPSVDEVERDRARLEEEEEAAKAAGDDQRAGESRALIERGTRLLARLRGLPPESYPYGINVWRMGDAVWVAVQGEPYNLLQTAIRKRFPGVPVIVVSIANGWGASYLPPAELYGQGIYQESIAVLEKGCLEKVIDQAGNAIAHALEVGTEKKESRRSGNAWPTSRKWERNGQEPERNTRTRQAVTLMRAATLIKRIRQVQA